jgi:hypothetical protein
VPPFAETLVGRQDELRSLDRALAEPAETASSALALVGEPGMGKTRLLAELCARAEHEGWLVLSGSASELDRELPFWVFVDALDEYLRALEPSQLGALDEAGRAQLSHVFPCFSGHPAGSDAGSQDERFQTHRAVRQLLEALARPKPLVLVLDDVHWADSGTIELLGSLLCRPPAAAALIAVAVRPRRVPERLSGAPEKAVRAGVMTRLGDDAALTRHPGTDRRRRPRLADLRQTSRLTTLEPPLKPGAASHALMGGRPHGPGARRRYAGNFRVGDTGLEAVTSPCRDRDTQRGARPLELSRARASKVGTAVAKRSGRKPTQRDGRSPARTPCARPQRRELWSPNGPSALVASPPPTFKNRRFAGSP